MQLLGRTCRRRAGCRRLLLREGFVVVMSGVVMVVVMLLLLLLLRGIHDGRIRWDNVSRLDMLGGQEWARKRRT